MIKIFLKKWWIVLISSLIFAGIAYACADGWGEEYGVSNFTPEVFVDSAYSPFFSSVQYYYKINYDDNQNERFNDVNVSDWSRFLGKSTSENELHYLLEKASQSSVDSALNYYNGKYKLLPDSLRNFGLFKTKNAKTIDFLNYLTLAKNCELFSVNQIPDYWDTDSKKKKPQKPDFTSLEKKLLDGMDMSKDVFLKERYWFQLVRFYYFNENPKQAIVFFDNYDKEMPHNPIYYRTLSYCAGAYKKNGEISKANYYYSKVYDGCDALKTTAHFSFHPQEDKDWKATLAMCANNEEIATLWQMLGVFYGDQKVAIKQIYQLDPKSVKLDLLLSRAVNIYEQKFTFPGSISAFNYEDTVVRSDDSMRNLIIQIAVAGNTAKPWVWNMAAGYLNTLDKKYSSAKPFYENAEKSLPKNDMAIAQLKLLKIINQIGEIKHIDSKTEDAILSDIKWLNTLAQKTTDQIRYSDAYAWLRQTVSEKYKKQGDLVKAECFSSKTSFYAKPNNVENMKTFLNKPSKTPYEKLCVDLSVVNVKDIYEFQAVQLTLKDSIDAAIEMLSKNDSASSVVLLANPFNGRILDCHDCDQADPQKIKYTEIAFLKKLKELKDKIHAGTDVYTNSMLLGNAFYNISHFGNDRIFHECKILGSGHSDPFSIEKVYRKMLTNMVLPTKYYSLALQNAQNDEQKAKSNYMLSKCQRNEWYNLHFYSKEDNQYGDYGMVDLFALDGFKELKKYPNTQFYKDVIKECGYFKKFVRK